jgi:hypothetical protein
VTLSRRGFLKGGATAATIAALPLGLAASEQTTPNEGSVAGLRFRRTASRIEVSGENGIEVKLMLDGKWLKGIGPVSFQGKPLRNTAECIWPEVSTPYGMEVCDLEFLEVSVQNDGAESGAIVISTRPHYRLTHRMEWTEHAMHPLTNTRSWSKETISPEAARLDWILREINETYDDVPYKGFSYAFRYLGPQYPIYQIEDKATWELGGQIVGNGFIMRGGGEPHARFSTETNYYSGWDLPGIANPHVFQHKPLYTQMQGFTFQYDPSHVLLTVHEHPSHVRSLFQRQAGQDFLLHFNQYCFDLTERHTTPARKILVGSRKDTGETTLANHYLRVRDHLQAQHRQYYALKYDKTRPVSHMEAKGLAQMEKFEPVLDQLKKWGINRAFIMPIWRSPDSDINPRFAKDRDRFGIFGNLCCPLELEIADCYGGWDGLKTLNQHAAALNIETFTWHATHFSSITPLLKDIPDLFCRDVNGQFNRNNYGHVLMAVNQRSPRYQEYLMAAYRKAKDCGLNGIFHDSHFNLATDTINFLHGDYSQEGKPASTGEFHFPSDIQRQDQILSMHDTALHLQSRLQNEYGFFYYVESEGALGTSWSTPDYAYVRGNEYIYSNLDSGFDLEGFSRFGDDVVMAYFRALAVRLTYEVGIDPNLFPEPGSVVRWWNPDVMVPFNLAFALVEDQMEEMWVLEDDRGIVWRGPDKKEVLFAYKDFDYPVRGTAEILDAVQNTKSQAYNALAAKRLGIYLVQFA